MLDLLDWLRLLCWRGSATSHVDHPIRNFLNGKWRLLLMLETWNLSLIVSYTWMVDYSTSILIGTWLLHGEETSCLWRWRCAIFLDNFNLVSWDYHFLTRSYYLCLLSIWLGGFAWYSHSFIVGDYVILLLLHWLRRLLLWSFAWYESHVLELNPLHNCSRGFSSVDSSCYLRWSL